VVHRRDDGRRGSAGSGDRNPNDNRHETFLQVPPTPRNYARYPFFKESRAAAARGYTDLISLSCARNLPGVRSE
jgi:hypothetical protein